MKGLPPAGPRHPYGDQRSFTSAQWKSLYRLQETVRTTFLKYGEKHVLVGALTFPYKVTDPRTAQKKFNSLLNWVRPFTKGRYLRIMETGGPGIHYHVLFVVDFDVMSGTGIHFLHTLQHATKAERLSMCNSELQAFWNKFERAARARGFGRVDLSPLRKNPEAVACYYTKEFMKNWNYGLNRQFKHTRLWNCSKALSCTTSKFCFCIPGKESPWKKTVYAFVSAHGFASLDEALAVYGKHFDAAVYRWCVRQRSAKYRAHRAQLAGGAVHQGRTWDVDAVAAFLDAAVMGT